MTFERFGDYPLDLAVDGPEFLRGPALHEFHRFGVETQQESFALLLSHVRNGSGVIDRGCRC